MAQKSQSAAGARRRVAELDRGRNSGRGRFLGLDIIDWSLLVGGVALVLLLALFA